MKNMAVSEARRKANEKWDKANTTRFSLKIRNELAAQIKAFLKTEEGKKYKSRNNFFVEAAKAQLKAHGFSPEKE